MRHDGNWSDSLSVQEVTTTLGLHALAAEWGELWRAVADSTPFQSPEWLIPWWHEFGQGGLWTLACRDTGGRLVGLAPLYVHTHAGTRTVRLLGAGVSDYLDVLALSGSGEAVVGAVIQQLDRHPLRWDGAAFQQLPPGAILLGTDGTHRDETTGGEPCPALRLDAGGGTSSEMSERLVGNLAADRRRLERHLGSVSLEAPTAETAAAMLADLRTLHSARWTTRGESGVLQDDRAWEFHRVAGARLWSSGVARLYALRAGGRVLGVYHGFLWRDRAYYYLGGFDPEFHQYGIGNILVAHAIREAEREGAAWFDFLRGREPYKYRWGAKDRQTYSRCLYRGARRARVPAGTFEPHVGAPGSSLPFVA